MRALALATLTSLALLACEEALQPYPFAARRFDPDQQCIGPSEVVDILNGPDPGSCDAARCWRSPSGEIYVTTLACEAPPDFIEGTEDPAGSPCAEALTALSAAAFCDP